jgi:anti-anti-sigma factor
MATQFDEYNGVGVLTPAGDLSGGESAELRKAVADCVDGRGGGAGRKVAGVVIDLCNARFIDGDGLEALLWARRRCEDALGRPVKLSGLEANCRKILEITRLSHRVECYPDLTAALKGMSC